ncbi:MAG TPA: VOC family protein [Gemmatimonadaceae bacterium]|jgi:catechol 2,3-dioxygenase-like lactoylglutathione lyase family enzyme
MSDSLTQLFADFDRGKISRRQLLHALAIATVAIPGASLFAQGTTAADSGRAGRGGRGGRGGGAGRAPRDTMPLVMPFEPTGWKTVWLDHLDYICVDYKKAAAFYATLMGWKVRSDNGKQCVLDIGENSGSIILRNGLQAPPPAAITDAGLGVTRPPIQAVYDGFAWGIDPWDEKKVEAELKKRGLNPVADHHGDYRAFKIKDPDNFDLAVTNGTKALRRKTPANGKLPAPAPFEPTNFNTLYLDHISFEVPDYRRSAAFYQALLGWMGRPGGGGQTTVLIGEGGVAGGAIIRGNAAARARGRAGGAGDTMPLPPTPAGTVSAAIGHISWGIENWNTERVHDELKKRDVAYTTPQGEREPRPDMTGTLESFHVPDAMGWDLQIGNKIAPGP